MPFAIFLCSMIASDFVTTISPSKNCLKIDDVRLTASERDEWHDASLYFCINEAFSSCDIHVSSISFVSEHPDKFNVTMLY